MAAKYIVTQTSNDQFRFVLKAANGETLLTSETYKAKRSALDGIASVKVNAPKDERYERKDAKNGSPMFNLKAANGEIIGTSEMYSNASAREGGIEAVKKNAPTAETDDRSNLVVPRNTSP